MKPNLVRWHNKYADKGLVIIDINLNNDTMEQIQKSAEQSEVEYAILRDPENKNSSNYGIKAYPMAYLFAPGKNGTFEVAYQGFPGADIDSLETLIKKEVTKLSTPPVMGKIDETVSEFLGDDIRSVLRKPDSVTSFRIDPMSNGDDQDGERLSGYLITATGPDLSHKQIANLQDLIRSKSNYKFDDRKQCEFMPGVALQFSQGDDEVVVLLCFSCDEWNFGMGEKNAHEDFDPVRKELLQLSKALFPKDKAIQGLKAKD